MAASVDYLRAVRRSIPSATSGAEAVTSGAEAVTSGAEAAPLTAKEEAEKAAPKPAFYGASVVATGVTILGAGCAAYHVIVNGAIVTATIVGAGTWAARRALLGLPVIPDLS